MKPEFSLLFQEYTTVYSAKEGVDLVHNSLCIQFKCKKLNRTHCSRVGVWSFGAYTRH